MGDRPGTVEALMHLNNERFLYRMQEEEINGLDRDKTELLLRLSRALTAYEEMAEERNNCFAALMMQQARAERAEEALEKACEKIPGCPEPLPNAEACEPNDCADCHKRALLREI